ncbi:MAG: OmpA family protein [Bifidobacteriaceae bacterium]|jgi:outer membrane protein OmpA-like peptidoglycan-associated protein|nr:OmpA family protein [Bifidobacteriaceae bacterium]
MTMVKRGRRTVGTGVLLVAMLALTGCSGQDSAIVTGEGYSWEGDDLRLGSGAEIQIVGDSEIPGRIVDPGFDLKVQFSTALDRDVTLTIDLGATEDTEYVNIRLPRNMNFAVTYDHFEGDLAYYGCWNGTCFGEYEEWFEREGEVKEFHVSGSGSDPGSGEGEGPVLTLNLVNGYIGSTTVYNVEFGDWAGDHDSADVGTRKLVALPADVLFKFGEATLAPGARDLIWQVAEEIPEDEVVKVDGHTDSKGSEGANARLAQERSRAVADVLREGRPDLSVTDEGHSSSQPVKKNEIDGKDNPAGRAANRRVEISYIKE